jgi:hypothetical protein
MTSVSQKGFARSMVMAARNPLLLLLVEAAAGNENDHNAMTSIRTVSNR